MLVVTAPAQSYRLAAVDALKNDLPGIEDAVAGQLLDQASAAIASYCRRVFPAETVQETIRAGNARPILQVTRWPIVTVQSIAIDGTALASGDYEVDPARGQILRLMDDCPVPWPAAKIVAVYSAGFETIPADLARAAITLAVAINAAAGRDATVRSEETVDVRSVSYFDPGNGGGAIPAAVEDLIAPYYNWSIG